MGGYYYETKAGDMWDYIAWKVYGSEQLVGVLYEAEENRTLLEIYIFDAGTRVWCPYMEAESEENEMPDWRDEEEL